MLAEDKYNQIASWFNTPEPEPELSPELSPEPKPPGLAPRIWSIVSLPITIILLITFIISVHINESFSLFMLPLLIIVASFYIIKRSEWKVAKKEWEVAKKKWEVAIEKAKKESEEAVAKYDALPSVSQMEQWMEEDLENLKKGALQKMALDESEIIADEVITRVPASEWTEWSPRSTKATEHKHYLFPVWCLTILYICERYIAIYRCEYDWGDNRLFESDDRLFNESRVKYFYSDMVECGRQSVGFDEIIRISLNGGKSNEIVLNEQGCTEPSNRADMAARVINRRIEDNKPEEPKPDN